MLFVVCILYNCILFGFKPKREDVAIRWDDYNFCWHGNNESKINESWNLLLGEGYFLSLSLFFLIKYGLFGKARSLTLSFFFVPIIMTLGLVK